MAGPTQQALSSRVPGAQTGARSQCDRWSADAAGCAIASARPARSGTMAGPPPAQQRRRWSTTSGGGRGTAVAEWGRARRRPRRPVRRAMPRARRSGRSKTSTAAWASRESSSPVKLRRCEDATPGGRKSSCKGFGRNTAACRRSIPTRPRRRCRRARGKGAAVEASTRACSPSARRRARVCGQRRTTSCVGLATFYAL